MNYYNALVNMSQKTRDSLDTFTEEDLLDLFVSYLDDVAEPIVIGGASYDLSYIWPKIDKIAFDQEFMAYIDSLDVTEHMGVYYRNADISLAVGG
jgi:hypothetical protein